MKDKNPFYFWLAVLLFIPLGYFVIDRTDFILTSQQTWGTVERITSKNDRCGRKRTRYKCTKYHATLPYEVDGRQYRISVTAGTARGHNQLKDLADHRMGERARVMYDPRAPTRAYRDAMWDIWGAPIATFLMQIAAFVASIRDRRRAG